MIPYNTDMFYLPAPIAHVKIRDPESKQSIADIPMLIDTGADISLIPQGVVEQLGLVVNNDAGYAVQGYNGAPTIAYPVLAEIVFLRRPFKGQFLVTETHYGILGRNVLNIVRLLFDGPNLMWGEEP